MWVVIVWAVIVCGRFVRVVMIVSEVVCVVCGRLVVWVVIVCG